MSVRLRRLFICAAILACIDLFICNIHWIEYRFLNGAQTAFVFPPFLIAVSAVVLFIAAFKEEIESRFYQLDGRLFGKSESYIPPEASVCYELLFAVFALAFGVVFVFLTPPMAAPDETNHFTRAYMLAHGQFLPTLNSAGKAVGYVSPDVASFLSKWNALTSYPGRRMSPQTLSGLLGASTTASASAASVSVEYPYPYLSFVLYLPQAAGILFGEGLMGLFHAGSHYNVYLQLVFARLANLFFYVSCIALAVWITPFFKRTLALLTLMPMAVFLAASCSYDVFLYCFCFLYLTYVLKCAYDPAITEIRPRDLFLLIFFQSCILFGKYVYFPLLFLIFLIPREKFHGLGRIKILLATALPSALCLLAWFTAYHLSTAGMAADSYSAAYKAQAVYVLSHPVQYAAMLIDNLYLYRQTWATGFVGLYGWLTISFPLPFVLFYIILLVVSALLETVINRTFLSRNLLGWTSAACYILVASAEYVIWTPSLGQGKVGQATIIGVQGRYFIPFAFPLLLLLANKMTYRTYSFGKLDALLHKSAVFIFAGCLLFSLGVLVKSYWLA